MPSSSPSLRRTQHRLRLGDVGLAVTEHGAPDAPTVVWLHGMMGHGREWDTAVAALAGRFRVLVPDQRGHGRSDWAGDYAGTTMAADLAAVILRLAAPPVAVVGHSLGGLVALLCAAERPDLVHRLAVLDVGPDSLSSPWGREELPGLLRAFAASSHPSVDAAVAEWLAGDPFAREPLLRHYVEHCLVPRGDGRLVWRFDAAGLVSFATAGVSAAQLWDAVDRIVAPTLVVRGRHSPLLSRDSAATVVRRLRHGELAEIPDAAHDLGVQQPEAVAAAVAAFLDR